MADDLISAIVSILTAVIGVAIIALLVSPRASTAGVIQSAGSAFNAIVGQAVQPVSA